MQTRNQRLPLAVFVCPEDRGRRHLVLRVVLAGVTERPQEFEEDRVLARACRRLHRTALRPSGARSRDARFLALNRWTSFTLSPVNSAAFQNQVNRPRGLSVSG